MSLKRKVLGGVNKFLSPAGIRIEPAKRVQPLKFFPYIIDKEIEGVAFNFFIGDSDGREWYHTRATDPHWPEMRFMRDKIIRNGDLVYECGAHHGCTTILLSKWAGESGKIMAFEPNRANYEIAKINISNNILTNVELIHGAVGKQTGEIMIDSSSSNSIIVEDKRILKKSEKVTVYSLDSFGKIPDVLKIDVEGYEKEVLLGSQKILQNKPKLAIEIHTDQLERYKTDVKDILDIIGISGYDFWIQWEDDKDPVPFSFEKQIDKRVHLFGIPKSNRV